MKKMLIIIIFIISSLLLISLLILTGYTTKNCDENHACFEKALETCENAKVRTVFAAGERVYEITGELDNKCKIIYTSKIFQEVTRICYVEKNSKFGTFESFKDHLNLICEN